MKASEAAAQPMVRAAMRKPKAPEANRARILKAAIDEFASRGFKGASMDAIASRTHTTRAMINYYFGGKEEIYLAVLEQVYAEIREAEGFLDLEHLPPMDAIRRIVEFTYDYYLAHQYFVRIVVAENQARGRHFPQVEGDAHAEPADHRLAGAGDRARPGRGQVSGAASTRWRSTCRSPRSACSMSPTSTPSAAFFSATWAPRAMSAAGAIWSPI